MKKPKQAWGLVAEGQIQARVAHALDRLGERLEGKRFASIAAPNASP